MWNTNLTIMNQLTIPTLKSSYIRIRFILHMEHLVNEFHCFTLCPHILALIFFAI